MKKSVHFFLNFIFIAFCLYSAHALAFVDAPTFAPTAPNSAQAIVVSVRSGICHGLGFGIPGGRPLRIEYSDGAIDIFSPGLINPSGACNFSIETTQFNVLARPPGSYRVRIWILNDLAAPPIPNTVLVSEAMLTVTQGAVFLSPVPIMGIGSSAILIALVFFGLLLHRNGTKHWAIFSITLLVSSVGFAQPNIQCGVDELFANGFE